MNSVLAGLSALLLVGTARAADRRSKTSTTAADNDGEDSAAYECKATMNVKGKVLSVACTLTAG